VVLSQTALADGELDAALASRTQDGRLWVIVFELGKEESSR
jgi:hypothetical protein